MRLQQRMKKLIIIVIDIIIIIINVLHTLNQIWNFTTPLPQSSYMYTIKGFFRSAHCLTFQGLLVWQ